MPENITKPIEDSLEDDIPTIPTLPTPPKLEDPMPPSLLTAIKLRKFLA